MNIDRLRKICLALPGASEQIQWGDDLLFKVGGKMFALTPLEPARLWLTLKADPEEFAELCEQQGILPAPYLARAKWIAIETPDTLPETRVTALIERSYELVVAKLPGTIRESLAARSKSPKAAKSKTAARKKCGHAGR